MNYQAITGFVIISSVVLLSVYDSYAYRQGGTTATISYQVLQAGYHWPIIAVAVGALIGHFFWRLGGTGQ
jgi:hypothetical protein